MGEIDPDEADRVLAAQQEERRRRDLAGIPEKIGILARDYVRAGGDPKDLIRVINDL